LPLVCTSLVLASDFIPASSPPWLFVLRRILMSNFGEYLLTIRRNRAGLHLRVFPKQRCGVTTEKQTRLQARPGPFLMWDLLADIGCVPSCKLRSGHLLHFYWHSASHGAMPCTLRSYTMRAPVRNGTSLQQGGSRYSLLQYSTFLSIYLSRTRASASSHQTTAARMSLCTSRTIQTSRGARRVTPSFSIRSTMTARASTRART
jgi:hypothetical protein